MAKKRGKRNESDGAVDEAVETSDGGVEELNSVELRQIVDLSPEGMLVVDPQSMAILFHNRSVEKLLKKKAAKFLAEVFPEELVEGAMRDYDFNKKVSPITWQGEEAVLVVMSAIASQQSSFHVEWRIEAAEERAREAEQKIVELQKMLVDSASAPAPAASDSPAPAAGGPDPERLAALESELAALQQMAQDSANLASHNQDLCHELEAENTRLEERVEQIENERAELETQARHLKEKAEEYEALMHEAESQSIETERQLEDVGDSLRELETKLEDEQTERRELQEKCYQLEQRLESLSSGAAEADTLREQLAHLQEQTQQLEAQLAENQHDLERSTAAHDELVSQIAAQHETIQQLEQLESDLQASLQLSQLDCETLQGSLTQMEQNLASAREQISQGIGSQSDIESKLEQFELERAELQLQLNQLTQTHQQLEEANHDLRARYDDSEQRFSELENLLVIAEERSAEQQTEIDDLKKREQELAAQMQELESAPGLAEVDPAQLAEAQKREEELERLLRQTASELEELKLAGQDSADLQAALDEQLNQHHLLEQQNQALETELGELRQKLSEIESVEPIASASDQVDSLRDEIEQVKSSLQQAQSDWATAEQKVELLEAELASAKQAAAVAALSAERPPAESGLVIPPDPEQDTEQLAFEDALTGLPNQNLIRRLLGMNLSEVVRENCSCALIHIDIDFFHVINETLGWKAGDELLQQVAERLREVVRDSDVVGRRGEDEFLVILTKVTGETSHPDSAAVVIQRMGQAFATPFDLGDQKVDLTVSMGISQYPGDANSVDELIEHCSTALRRSKQVGRNVAKFYTAEMQERFEARNRLRIELQKSLENVHFGLVYQPIISLRNGLMVGVESLLRWNHPSYGRLEPEHFLDVAEESGLLIPLGKWIIDHACHQSFEWSKAGLDIFVTVNLSHREFLQADLCETVQRGLETSGALPQSLVFEVPESFQQTDPGRAAKVAAQLRKLGVRVALDRFGTSATRLEYLNSDLFQFLKIDRSFVSQLHRQGPATKVTSACIQLAKNLNQKSVAVGVETQDQLDMCRQLDCDYVQGKLVHAPVEAAIITDLFRTGRVLR
jgi:diguanylate cyclase (GGDEF)-like protein